MEDPPLINKAMVANVPRKCKEKGKKSKENPWFLE
jgi:hypothetical protein